MLICSISKTQLTLHLSCKGHFSGFILFEGVEMHTLTGILMEYRVMSGHSGSIQNSLCMRDSASQDVPIYFVSQLCCRLESEFIPNVFSDAVILDQSLF